VKKIMVNKYQINVVGTQYIMTDTEEKAIEGIKTTQPVPGRFEVIGNENKKVIIDYSHTPDSLEKTLLNIKKLTEEKIPVYTVFGCGGNRDKEKRPEMASIACLFSDKVIFTSDNPRDEDPDDIIDEMKKGVSPANYKKTITQVDRKEAIKLVK